MSCEYCWKRSTGIDGPDGYYAVMRRAESEGWECTKPTEGGERLRAGEYWDAANKRDKRKHITPPTTGGTDV